MSKAKPPGLVAAEPPTKGHDYDWEAIGDYLRTQPGQWHKVFDRDRHSLSVAIRQGSIKALTPGSGIEYRTSNTAWENDVRLCTLFLRYNPDKDVNRSNGRKKK